MKKVTEFADRSDVTLRREKSHPKLRFLAQATGKDGNITEVRMTGRTTGFRGRVW